MCENNTGKIPRNPSSLNLTATTLKFWKKIKHASPIIRKRAPLFSISEKLFHSMQQHITIIRCNKKYGEVSPTEDVSEVYLSKRKNKSLIDES